MQAQGAPPALRGDTDNDGAATITDAIFILQYLFALGPAPRCKAVADVNADQNIDISDGVFLLLFLFLGSQNPAPLTQNEILDCGGDPQAAIAHGKQIFETADPGAGKKYACATCHAAVPDGQSPVIHAGHTMAGAIRRPSFKSGQVQTFLGAANVCRKDWMLATEWAELHRDFKDLVAYLTGLAPPDPVPALQYTLVQPAVVGPSQGNPEEGCRLFNRSCSVCHGMNGAGTPLGPNLTLFPLGHAFLRAKIRLSGPRLGSVYQGLRGGLMPFWSLERLSDAQVEDLVAYLTAAPIPICGDQ